MLAPGRAGRIGCRRCGLGSWRALVDTETRRARPGCHVRAGASVCGTCVHALAVPARSLLPSQASISDRRHRTVRSKGCLSNKTALAMVFKLAQAAQNSWRRLDGHNQLPKLIVGVKFIDGIEAVRQQPQAAA